MSGIVKRTCSTNDDPATASQPQIAVSDAKADQTYVFMMVDLDVPPMGGGNGTRRTLLHAMNTGFKATQQSMGGAMLLATTDKGPATYIGPSPPPQDTIPHRYVEMLFKQPESLQVSATDFANSQSRIGFDVESFVKENNLGEPLAANFFTVDGRAKGGATASGTAASSGGMPQNTVQPFTGAGRKLDVSFELVAGLTGLLAFLGV